MDLQDMLCREEVREEFIKKLEQATETVKSWPKWKQNLMGPSLPNVDKEKSEMKTVTVWYKCDTMKDAVRRVYDRVISVDYPNHGKYIHISYFDEDDLKCKVTYLTHRLVEVEEEYSEDVR